ncbi:MAG: CRISPR-associated endonuclease Cas1 [Acidobacteriia bacterium]|nr:CRISPR-associated endonuclease Cas1 [Terriglobia bacterium]
MAATKTLSQFVSTRNSCESDASLNIAQTTIAPRSGVVTLAGYGIHVGLDRGHLLVKDGIGSDRRAMRFPRVGHRLRRLVVIGSDGMVSLAALRWLADQDAAFVMLDRDGSVLATTGPVRPSDAKLRRAQALAHSSGSALRIARELIGKKLLGQETVVRDKLLDDTTAKKIAHLRIALDAAEEISSIRLIESQAALAYWTAWSNLPIFFPKNVLARVPEHWRTFGSRHSPLTGSPRLAANPPNAMLNYLYAVLETEARLAVAALGLDPGLGVLHVDTPARDSLACDVMEPVRPLVDSYLLDWITREPLSREWFFEQRDGNCRLMAPFAIRLSETAPTWGRAVAPFAEWVARSFWLHTRNKPLLPPTRLTQQARREAKGQFYDLPVKRAPRPQHVCATCGKPIEPRHEHCRDCLVPLSTESLKQAANAGRMAAQSDEAQRRRAETHRKHILAQSAWSPSSQPAWLTDKVYSEQILPKFGNLTNKMIAETLGVSMPYAADVRKGKRHPHPRHWQTLAELVGVSGNL